MKKEVILIVEKIWVNSTLLIVLFAILFMVISYSLPEEYHKEVFVDVFLAILFSVGCIMGIISIIYFLYKRYLMNLFSKEDSANKSDK